ncbi:MAG: tetratricopeptide repeat protein, partial [Leptolyngbyaceae cyanobacterium SM1_3_5]|nr:tetratricopeptide repeat protein [Leptolyngbyaceae cyanobacterium SM1_3_5]
LHQLAGIYAQQGQVEQAIALYQQSLDLKESIGNVQGKAATLNNLSHLAFQAGNTAKALDVLRQSAQALGQARSFADLFTVLSNLSVADQENAIPYLAQALWLGLRIQTPLPDLVNLLRFFFNQVPQGDELEALLATTALFVCGARGEGHPQLNDLQTTSIKLLAMAAAAQGIQLESMEALSQWREQQQLNDPAVFLPRLIQRLETMVGDQWVFDPGQVG